ncbi:retropepsin-like aspartic protease [Carnimonas bestiolae]|uniref:retropepsin-like aspartic protease n=1 Tax=Carnimonas bestiolae TaxID=3402172 RepID=UPI003F4ACC07
MLGLCLCAAVVVVLVVKSGQWWGQTPLLTNDDIRGATYQGADKPSSRARLDDPRIHVIKSMFASVKTLNYDQAASDAAKITTLDLSDLFPEHYIKQVKDISSQLVRIKQGDMPSIEITGNSSPARVEYNKGYNDFLYIAPTITTQVDGVPIPFVVDTGMPVSTITSASAKASGVQVFDNIRMKFGSTYSNGETAFRLGIIKNVDVAGRHIKNYPIWVGGKFNALGLDFIGLFSSIKLTDNYVEFNAPPPTESRAIRARDSGNLLTMEHRILAAVAINKEQLHAQVDTGNPYFLIKRGGISSCVTPLLYNGSDIGGVWTKTFCPEVARITDDSLKRPIVGVMRVIDGDDLAYPASLNGGFLSLADLYLDNTGHRSGFYWRPGLSNTER